jgi:ATP/maltotriose-dependent transcriptional regulator MalT
VLLLPLFTRAELHRRTGRLDLALADAAEAVRLGHDLGQQTATAPSVSVIALIDGIRGRSAECRSHVQELRALAARAELDFALVLADGALGLLELGSGELEEALRHLRSADRRRHGGGGFHHPLVDNYEQDLAETLIRLGQHDEADDVLSSLDRMARSSGTLWPTAAVARCRGLMAGDDFEPHFAAALSLLERTTVPFELARTQLCLGERRRRARRARDAREPLTAALATFEALGAAPWADWARRELRAAGARPRGPRSPSSEALTPQELQVAVAVAEGATNKEAATALLISPKTVEYHLGKVYEKLGVRSRAELAGRIAREGVSPSGTEATKD